MSDSEKYSTYFKSLPNYLFQKVRLKTFLSFFALIAVVQLFAEGTKQVSPTQNDWAILTLAQGFAGYGSASTNRALCIEVLDANEEVYIALSELAYGDFRSISNSPYEFRILDSARNVVHGPFTINSQNANGKDYNDVVAGPDLGSGTGYDVSDPAFHFSPGFKGQFCIEFRLTSPFNIFGGQNQGIVWWDFTVMNAAGMEQPGRLFSKNWSFRTTCDNCNDIFSQPFVGEIFVLTDDGFVHSIEFQNSGFRGLTFDLAFNRTGPGTSGDYRADRRSVNGTNATNPQFRIFLNDPDPQLYNEPSIGALLRNPEFTNPGSCDTLRTFCFDFEISQPGSIEMILDLDQQDSLFTAGTADFVLMKVYRDTIGSFTVCVDWDSRDGLGNSVDLNQPVQTLINYSQGEVHFMMHDVEYNNPGYEIEVVHPSSATQYNKIYYDDSQLASNDNDVNLDADNNSATGTNPTLIELNGCDSPCHNWNRNTTTQTRGFGESNTINSWWQGNLQAVQLGLSGFCASNEIVVDKSVTQIVNAVSGTPGNYDVTFEILIENTGGGTLNNLQLTDDMNNNFGSAYIGLVQAPVFSAEAGTPSLPNASASFGTNLFNGTSGEIKTGDILKVVFTVELNPSATGTLQVLTNQAEAFGENLISNDVGSDLSINTASPMTDDAPTIIQFPKIGLAKRIVTLPASSALSGAVDSYDLMYEFLIENLGNTTLNNISLKDNFETQFLAGFTQVVGNPIIEPTITTAAVPGGINLNYSGDAADDELLDESATLAPGEKLGIRVVVEIAPHQSGVNLTASGELSNSGLVRGIAGAGLAVTDISDTGTDASDDNNPSGINPGELGDTGGTDDPTLFPIPGIPEICDNMLDDDGDGLVDCEDSDCGFLNPISVIGDCDSGLSVENPLPDWTFQWFVNNNSIVGETSATYNVSGTGGSDIITVEVTNSAGCFVTSAGQTCCSPTTIFIGN